MRTLATISVRRPNSIRAGQRPLGHIPGAIGRERLHPRGNPASLAPVVRRRGFFGRLARGVARPPQLTPEEQFRLLEVALRIKLRREGKPEDAVMLQRPADLPAPPGTPLRQPRLRPVPYDSGRIGARGGVGGRR